MLFQTGTQLDEIVDVAHVSAVDVGSAIAIVIIAVIVATVTRKLLTKYLMKVDQFSDPVSVAVIRGVTLLIIAIGVLLALPLLGFKVEPAMVLVIIGGILIFFAARPLMEDFSASLILQTRTPFVIGDVIRHHDYLGTVTDIDGRATVIETAKGETIRVRNTSILADPIINLTASKYRRSDIAVGVAYGTDLDYAAAVFQNAVDDLPGVLKDPAPDVMATEFDDSAITIKVRVWHLPSILDETIARDETIRSIDRACRVSGIVIAFPQRDIWMRSESDSPESKDADASADHAPQP